MFLEGVRLALPDARPHEIVHDFRVYGCRGFSRAFYIMCSAILGRKTTSMLTLAFFIAVGTTFLWVFYSKSTRLRMSRVISEQSTSVSPQPDECLDIRWSDPRYCSHSPPGDNETTKHGASFDFSSAQLASFGIPLTNFVPLERSAINRFVFVTAASGGFLHIVMDAIGNVQRHFPNQSIYYYDLAENTPPDQILKIQRICNVKYRTFNYSRYPAHVRGLRLYSFKPIIVHEMLSEFPGVFWIDSSIRFHSDNFTSALDQIYENNGILAFARSHHSNFAATHSGMYSYLPISAAAASMTEQRDANSIFFYRTEEVYRRIVVWWVLCALKEDCMAAGRELACSFNGKKVWAGCHRFDQSAINILMARHFQYDDLKYLSRDAVLTVERGSAHQELIEVCYRNRTKSSDYFA